MPAASVVPFVLETLSGDDGALGIQRVHKFFSAL